MLDEEIKVDSLANLPALCAKSSAAHCLQLVKKLIHPFQLEDTSYMDRGVHQEMDAAFDKYQSTASGGTHAHEFLNGSLKT